MPLLLTATLTSIQVSAGCLAEKTDSLSFSLLDAGDEHNIRWQRKEFGMHQPHG